MTVRQRRGARPYPRLTEPSWHICSLCCWLRWSGGHAELLDHSFSHPNVAVTSCRLAASLRGMCQFPCHPEALAHIVTKSRGKIEINIVDIWGWAVHFSSACLDMRSQESKDPWHLDLKLRDKGQYSPFESVPKV